MIYNPISIVSNTICSQLKKLIQNSRLKSFSVLLTLAFFSSCIEAEKTAEYLKFDNDPPGLKPKLFAKALISKNDEHVGYCAFNRSGSELYYTITNSDWFPVRIIKISSNDLDKKDTLFLKDKIYETEPFITSDDQALYFGVGFPPQDGRNWHTDIFWSHRTADGWSTPERLDTVVNSLGSEWHVSLTDKNKMYFVSEREKGTSALNGDIYSIEINGNQYSDLTKLPYPINTEYNDSDPLIAPDESFLIFHSDRPGGFGEHDLYISFNEHGKWTDPVNMGKVINTNEWEMAPTLTPDGKYLLFTRRKSIVTPKPSQIYWVSTEILNSYR